MRVKEIGSLWVLEFMRLGVQEMGSFELGSSGHGAFRRRAVREFESS